MNHNYQYQLKEMLPFFQNDTTYQMQALDYNKMLADKFYVLFIKLLNNFNHIASYIRYKDFYDLYILMDDDNYDFNKIKSYFFKRFNQNETYNHLSSDDCLKIFSAALQLFDNEKYQQTKKKLGIPLNIPIETLLNSFETMVYTKLYQQNIQKNKTR